MSNHFHILSQGFSGMGFRGWAFKFRPIAVQIYRHSPTVSPLLDCHPSSVLPDQVGHPFTHTVSSNHHIADLHSIINGTKGRLCSLQLIQTGDPLMT